jgi:hypothetical protein
MVATVDTEKIYFAAVIKRDEKFADSNVLALLLLENTDKKDSRKFQHLWANFDVPSNASEATLSTRVLKYALQYVSASQDTILHLTVPFRVMSKDLTLYPRLELETTPQKQNPAWPLLLARVSQMRGF